MLLVYNILANTAEKILPVSGLFSQKMRLFTDGRKHVFEHLRKQISAEDKVIWFHAASLGEYEQAVPVIEKVKEIFPKHKILVSFFSPSGYEIKKNSQLADILTYLPLDTSQNAEQFLDLVHPEWAIFIKYEFWPNFLKQLKLRNIKTLLVSGAFRKDQVFFKPYGSWMRKYLKAFDYFFLQNKESEILLKQIGFSNSTVSGDTRFDRVHAQLEENNQLDFVGEFVDEKLCLVAGSTWPEDEELLLDYINKAPKEQKFIIAPHTLKPARIKFLQEKLKKSSVLFSKKDGKELSGFQVFIVDTIGLLTRIYNYADVAYVGGAAGETGLHNILEPATFGVPVIIGKNYRKFPEAAALKKAGGLFSVTNKEETARLLKLFFEDPVVRQQHGQYAKRYIEEHKGATKAVINYLIEHQDPG